MGMLLLFLFGFYILVRGAKLLVRGAGSVAKTLGINDWVIGVLIVGIGTSLPEFSINIAAALQGNPVGIGTIIGSNTFNILVVLGVSAIISPAVIKPDWVRRDFLINFLVILLATVFLLFPVLGEADLLGITRQEALLFFALFIGWVVFMLRRRPDLSPVGEQTENIVTVSAAIVMIVLGLVGVYFGGRFVVDGAETLATLLGISPSVIGVLIVGIGTSLPELAVSVTAALNRNTGLAVGNIMGSNIFDFLGIIGVAGLIAPIPFTSNLGLDVLTTALAALLLIVAMFVGKRYILERWQGVVFVIIYVFYVLFVVLRAPFGF